MNRDEAIEVLAERMHWKFEHIDPTGEPIWAEVDEEVKENYRIVIRSLLCDRRAIAIALS